MNIKPLNLLISPNNRSQNNKQTNVIQSQPLKYDSVSFGLREEGVDFNLQKLVDRLEINDLAIKELDKAKAQKIIKQKELIMLRNNIQRDSSDVGILRAFGTKTKENPDGTISISGFKNMQANLSFKDLGIDGDEVFSRVKIVEDDINLYGTNVTCMDSLEEVRGKFSASGTLAKADKLRVFDQAVLNHSLIKDLPSLDDVKTKIVINSEQYKSFGPKLEALALKPAIEVC